MKKALILCFILIISVQGYGQKRDTFRVYFPLNENKVSKKAARFIDSLVAKKILKHGEKLTVLGYADYLGSSGYNDTLSSARAKNVADRLIKAGVERADIQLCTGKGKIDRAPVHGRNGYADDRNVQIIRGWIKPAKDSLHIDVSRIHANSVYPLNVLFENARSTMLPESNGELQKVYDFLNKYKTIVVRIEGHICCLDPKERAGDGVDFNDGGRLSLNRAKVIYEYLVKRGIDKNRLSYVGLGNTKPMISPEVTEDDKKQNRRVEIRILSK
jgi:outer membrane protein OmpA-like peptidoglycan-associated protein